jgi:prolyl oligopeptidase
LTDKGAPKRRVVSVDINHPEESGWKTIIPEAESTLEGVTLLGKTFFATYLKDAHSEVVTFDLTGGNRKEVSLPGIGTAAGFGGHRKDKTTFFNFAGFTTPSTVYRLELETGKVATFRQPALQFDPHQYETAQVFYSSKDGTKIPMFISHKKGMKLDGQNPTLLYGYGGFNISMTPFFSPKVIQWMEMGGVYVVANIRGGGEYGKAWYDAGRLKNKQNVFDDFIAAAEYLIADRITSTPKLGINGGSNGGLLIGACETQRPDLFGACLPEVGVMDVLRFHKFTIGYGWKSDYGDPEVEDDFKVALKYSPLHNIKLGVSYPPTLIFTGDHDDRVVPAHSFKFAATLQHDQAGSAPILIRIETSAGHGAGMPVSKLLDLATDQLAFLVKNLHVTVP